MKLNKKRILITGGALRVGKFFVKNLQSQGAEVIVHYNKSKKDAENLSEYTIHANLSNPSSYDGLIKKIGPIDVLINNASLFTKDRLKDSTPSRVLNEFNVNFFAPFELIRQFAEQDRAGSIINILDQRIDSFDLSCVAYSLTKQALAKLTFFAAKELAPKICVNGIAPGPVLAPNGMSESAYRESAGIIPLNDTPTPQDVVKAANYLLDNPSITGQIIYVDGGQHLIDNKG